MLLAAVLALSTLADPPPVEDLLEPVVRVRLEDETTGSGTLIRPDLVLTAGHLFFREEGREDVRIFVDLFDYDADGRICGRETVDGVLEKCGTEADDLAIIRIETPKIVKVRPMPVLPPDLCLRVSQKCFVVGCPKALDPRITAGRISFLGEYLGTVFVGATAPVYFGNSGGPLVVKVGGTYYLAGVFSRMEVDPFSRQVLTHLGYHVPPEIVIPFILDAMESKPREVRRI